MRQLNENLASVTGLLVRRSERGRQRRDSALNAVVGDVQSFIAENRETLGATADKLASVSQRR